LIQQGKLTRESLFDNDYVAIEGSDPVQYVTKFLPALEDVLPPVQEALLAGDQRMVFCAAGGYSMIAPGWRRRATCAPTSSRSMPATWATALRS
jgi:hypothetical protein